MEFFNALAQLDGWKLSTVYSRQSAKERAWQMTSIILHQHWFLDGARYSEIMQEIIGCDLVVFGGYRPAKVAGLIKLRNRTGKAWVFWGERPGFHFPGWLGAGIQILGSPRGSIGRRTGLGDWRMGGRWLPFRAWQRALLFKCPLFL